jgi:hypothetical protein
MLEQENPCLNNGCGKFCCNPVKLRAFTELDEKAKERFTYLGRFARESCPDGSKLDIYSCKEFDEVAGRCKDYEGRPDICKNTRCALFDCKDEQKREEILKKQRENFYELAAKK